MTSPRVIAALACVGMLSACSLAPKYHQPDLPMPENFSVTASQDTIPDLWWQSFGDATLDSLVDEALANNQDLAAAAARVEQARAIAGVAKSALYPEINVQGTGSRTQITDQAAVGRDNPFNTFDLLGTISYELDFWGKLRNANKAARNQMLASEEGRRNVELSLISDVITTYFDLLSQDRELAVSRATLESRRESVRLQQLRYDAGSISQLDLSQAQAEFAATEATVPVFERQVRQSENRLGVLLGRIGGTVDRAPDGGEIDSVLSPEIPVGLPSVLIARRPDVMGAEYAMIGANANIGVARAQYLPSISLTGYGGWESNDLSQLITKNNDIWQGSVSIFQTIFAPGRTQRQVDLAWGRYRETYANYIGSVQVAFADVEDALVARRTSVLVRAAEDREVKARTQAKDLAQIRYDAGDSSYIEVLDAQRQLFQAQVLQAEARRSELVSFVQLYKALGGGWQTDEQMHARQKMAGKPPEK
ncbi:MAG TPA: efflux transporter outer membrane subunit [Candidatus Krumholzibacteria bacterium]|nr:efflux transporter outer membrane subunit [Candidatus Krumholzibacteria bacterium]